jgi:hypothetical protein
MILVTKMSLLNECRFRGWQNRATRPTLRREGLSSNRNRALELSFKHELRRRIFHVGRGANRLPLFRITLLVIWD